MGVTVGLAVGVRVGVAVVVRVGVAVGVRVGVDVAVTVGEGEPFKMVKWSDVPPPLSMKPLSMSMVSVCPTARAPPVNGRTA